MANSKISALTSATTPLAGTEVLPVVQSSATTQVTVANLTAGRAVNALTYSSTSTGSFNTAYTASVASYVYCDNTAATGAILNIRRGRDIGSGSVDAVGLDCLNSAGSTVVPGAIRANPLRIIDAVGTTSFSGGNVSIGAGNLSIATSGKGITTGSAIPLGFGTNGGTAAMTLNTTGTLSVFQATTAAAPTYVKGAMYFDTTLNKLRIGGATAWETVTSV